MPRQEKDPKCMDLIAQLKNLSREDRTILGLYLYEGLTSDQVHTVLQMQPHTADRKKSETKIPVKNSYKTL
jgi:hypothetical protein